VSFWGELKRRNVFKVGAAYVIVAWLTVQAANTFFPLLGFPRWTVPLVAVLAIPGFPLALLFARTFESTPEGIKKTEHVPPEEIIPHVTGRKLDYVLGGLLIIAAAYILVDNLYLHRRVVKAETAKTIAVLPFADLSPEKNQVFFVDGLSGEILNCLAQIPELRVIEKTSSFSFKGKDKTIQEIAHVLGADHVLEGGVMKFGDELRITVQLVRADDGARLWSETYNRKFEDIFAVQEDIATSVANKLSVAPAIGKTFKQTGGTDDMEAYELYLIAQSLLDNIEFERAVTALDEALRIDPEFALAWALVAPVKALKNAEKGKEAALKSIEAAPKLAEGYDALGFINNITGNWADARRAFLQSFDLRIEPSIRMMQNFAGFYSDVGYLDKMRDLLEKIIEKDPLNTWIRYSYISYLGMKGDFQRAEAEDSYCKILFGDLWNIHADWAITWVRLGYDNDISRDRVLYSEPITDTATGYLDSPQKGLQKLRRIFDEDENLKTNNFGDMAIWAAYFGDPEFAMDAMERACRMNVSSAGFIWHAVFREIRQTSRFKELVREIGLVDFWNDFGWPDLCKPTGDGDFKCD